MFDIEIVHMMYEGLLCMWAGSLPFARKCSKPLCWMALSTGEYGVLSSLLSSNWDIQLEFDWNLIGIQLEFDWNLILIG